MADLITLSEYKALQGIQAGDDRNDVQISALLPAASRAVRTYTGRQFEANTGVATTRTFQHDGSEMLDIDDCTAITSLSTDGGVPGNLHELSSDQWTAMPQDDSEVFYYVLLQGGPYLGMSPEMGFTYNLDRYELNARNPMISVTATWGWPSVPDDVKLAVAITVGEMVASPGKAEGMTAEAIEGWSRSWGGRNAGLPSMAVPNRARDLLVGYQRIFV